MIAQDESGNLYEVRSLRITRDYIYVNSQCFAMGRIKFLDEGSFDRFKKENEIDYEQRHYEVAKEILAARFNTLTKLKTHPKRQVEMALQIADIFIEELKKRTP